MEFWTGLFWTIVGAGLALFAWQVVINPILDNLPRRGGFIRPQSFVPCEKDGDRFCEN